MPPDLFMVMDVESVGLHGEGFAAAYVVVDRGGSERESGVFECDAGDARGMADGLQWVRANVVSTNDAGLAADYRDGLGSRSPKAVRDRFWERWQAWKAEGAILAADCLWPVEARFLIACIEDDPVTRQWGGPYPFLEIASVRLAAGLDPLGTEERLPRELPAHNPLADARQSARLLIESLDAIAGRSAS